MKKDRWFWILTISSVIILCFLLVDAYFNTSDGQYAIGLLYPLASHFSDIAVGKVIIDTGLFLNTLFGLLFLLSLPFNLMYFVIQTVYLKRIAYKSVIPFLISIISIIIGYVIPYSAISSPTTNIDSNFYNIAPKIEIYVPELEYKKLDRKYALGECYSLMQGENIPETKIPHEVQLPSEYEKLSSTGKFYYWKMNGQEAFYFPQKDFENNYQMGYLWLSDENTANIHNLYVVFQMRCGWYEIFGKKISEGSKL